MNERKQSTGGMTTRENQRIHRKKLSKCHFINHKSKTDWPGTEPKASTMTGQKLTHSAMAQTCGFYGELSMVNYKPYTAKLNANGLTQDLQELTRLSLFTQQLQHWTKNSFTTKSHSHWKLLLGQSSSKSRRDEQWDIQMLTWYRLLTGGCGGAIGHNIICITTVITPSNPRTDMIQWHLLNKWGAIFAEVPPLKYLKVITLYVLYMLECIHWSVGKPLDTGEQGKDLSQWMIQRTVTRHMKWFGVRSTGGLSLCVLFIAYYWQFPDVVTVTPQNILKYLLTSAHANSAHWRWQQSECHMTISMYTLSGL